jgi:hypothetical protein
LEYREEVSSIKKNLRLSANLFVCLSLSLYLVCCIHKIFLNPSCSSHPSCRYQCNETGFWNAINVQICNQCCIKGTVS